MTEQEYNHRFDGILSRIRTLPPAQQKQLQPLIEETRARHESVKRATDDIEEMLGTWRLLMKYCAFTLEARAREKRDHLN